MRTSLLLLLFSTSLYACDANTPVNKSISRIDTTDAPVETKKPNSEFKSAFPGQTRIRGVHTKSAFEVKILSQTLKRPWGIAALPNGRFLITEKGGKLVIASGQGELSKGIAGTPKVDDRGQGGLLDVAIEPGFANRMVYLTFSEDVGKGNLTAVGKGTLSADESKLENFTVIYRATPAYDGHLHFGSRIVIDKAGNLFITTGERSDKVTRPQAQDLNSSLGKVIRITKDGKPVEGNPFQTRNGAKPEIYTYGHRNAQGMDIHPQTGEIWVSEMGPRGGDEVNRIEAGKNYGWPTIGYGIEYNGDQINNGKTAQDGMEQPVYYWDPVLSPSGMTFYAGDRIPEWKNNLFICGLSSQHIARLVIENNKVTGEERLLSGESQRFRDIAEGTDGALYTITDDGRLYRIGSK